MNFADHLDPTNSAIFTGLTTPLEIQAYLDSLPYIGEDRNRAPLQVMQDRQCHCLDGGMLAALALSHIGFPPLLLDLVPEPFTDDDHVLAIFNIDGCYGAVAKSNFAGLRYREPVYRSLRELVMSYFEVFFNVDGLKTLRGYMRPFNLARYNHLPWQVDEQAAEQVNTIFYARKMIPVINPAQISRLSRLDERSYRTNMIGVNMDGLYKGPSGGH
ncbi:MAG: hypothetical protein HY835_12510 [Anaerolineae bacterium]|nr:hypothetical protein [Anaerolineae bacterium]